MIDFPIGELLDDRIWLIWLERHLHAEEFACPHCGSTKRRLFREQGYFPAYRGQACDGYDTLLTGTVFEKTRQRPAALVLLLRGVAKGEPTGFFGESEKFWALALSWVISMTGVSHLLPLLTS